jgi:CBS domain-containing protein
VNRVGPAIEPAAARGAGLSLFVGRVRDLVKGPPLTCRPDTPVAEAARRMSARGAGSILVLADDGGLAGIVTDRDLRSKVVAEELTPATPTSRVMSTPVVTIAADALALDVLLEMMRRNIHHLAVVEAGRLSGVVSGHDLVMLQGAHPVALAREIDQQESVDGLAEAAARIPRVIRRLSDEGAGALDLGRIVAELNDRLVRRALRFAEAAVGEDGAGPPAGYAWLAAGSEGRREQTLKTDQDNALVYEDPPADRAPAVAAYFAALARVMGDTLPRLGFPPCDGGFMASNPRWCQPVSAWQQHFDGWMATPTPEPLLHASIFFDLRPIGGDLAVGRALWEWVCERAPGAILFLRHMARAAVERTPPLGLFGRFVVERSGANEGRLDLKARGVFPLTQAMRVYALSLGIRETNTAERLREVGARGVLSAGEVAELRDACEVMARIRFRHQLAAVEAGRPPDNFVNPAALGKADRLLLREAFKSVAWLQRYLEERFGVRL